MIDRRNLTCGVQSLRSRLRVQPLQVDFENLNECRAGLPFESREVEGVDSRIEREQQG